MSETCLVPDGHSLCMMNHLTRVLLRIYVDPTDRPMTVVNLKMDILNVLLC